MKELKLKVGDKVYDSFYFGGIEGVVTEVNSEPGVNYIYKVYFATYYTFYNTCGTRVHGDNPTLSLEPYEVNLNIVTEKQETFEFGDKVMHKGCELLFVKYSLINKNDVYIIDKCGVFGPVQIKDLTKI